MDIAPEVAAAAAGRVCEATVEAVAEAIVTLLEDDASRARLAASGRDFARRYDWSAVAPQLVDMYAAVIESRGTAPPPP
jgi:glycosyltransferase involved in cell wall biosynthesis